MAKATGTTGRAKGGSASEPSPETEATQQPSKPWLKSYPKNMAAEIGALPANSIGELLVKACKQHAGRTAFVSMGTNLSYAQLERRSAALAAWLQSRGIRKGARVALMMPNVLQYPIAMMALLFLVPLGYLVWLSLGGPSGPNVNSYRQLAAPVYLNLAYYTLQLAFIVTVACAVIAYPLAYLLANIESAVYSASNIRDRFSPDGWLALKDLSKTVHRFATVVAPGDDATRAMTVLLRKLAGFSGLLHENMYRFTGWRFLEIGRRLERGIQIARMLARLTRPDASDGALDMMLEIGDSVMTHRRQYPVQASRHTVIDLLALDPLNPRSILFQLNEIHNEVEQLPNALVNGQMSPLSREAMRLHSGLAVMTPEALTAQSYRKLEQELEHLSDLLAQTYLG